MDESVWPWPAMKLRYAATAATLAAMVSVAHTRGKSGASGISRGEWRLGWPCEGQRDRLPCHSLNYGSGFRKPLRTPPAFPGLRFALVCVVSTRSAFYRAGMQYSCVPSNPAAPDTNNGSFFVFLVCLVRSRYQSK